MTSQQIDMLRRMISRRKYEISRRYAERQRALSELSEKAIGDVADDASRDRVREMQYALDENDRRALEQMEVAEQRFDSGSFGICQNCGEQIEMRRLLAVPATTLCFACADQQGRSRRDTETDMHGYA